MSNPKQSTHQPTQQSTLQLITEQLSHTLKEAFRACGYDETLGQVVVSDRSDLCQFQCNGAMKGAKSYKKSPMVIASEVVAWLNTFGENTNETYQRNTSPKTLIAPPGFINIRVTDEYLAEYVMAMVVDPFMGIPQAQRAETIVLDYGNPNVAKPLHVGHLRSAIIGETLKRLIEATGRRAIGDVHLGDWGLPMGLVIAELEERFGTEVPELTAAILNEVYPFASQKSKSDTEFLERARSITAALQKGHPHYAALWRQMVATSREDIKGTFDRLNVRFDYWYGESDASPYVPELLVLLTEQGLLEVSEGAQVVTVSRPEDKAPMPPTILVKSNGSEGYATTDIATILQRQRDFKPDQIWYVVDFRQNLHFNQVFRTAQRAKLVPDSTQLVHLCFGTVNGSDGKPFKTRDGGVMQLDDLLNSVAEAAYQKLRVPSDCDEASKRAIAEKIGIAAVKFGDLVNHYAKDCIFDIEKFTASEGKTGVYLLYTVARINSLLRKAEAVEIGDAPNVDMKAVQLTEHPLSTLDSSTARELLLKISLMGNAYLAAFQERSPNILCESAYQIAVAFSRFYHENHILGEVDPQKRATWLGLCRVTKAVLEKHLHTLAIDPVDRM